MRWTMDEVFLKKGVAGVRGWSPSLWLSPRTAGREDTESRVMRMVPGLAMRCELGQLALRQTCRAGTCVRPPTTFFDTRRWIGTQQVGGGKAASAFALLRRNRSVFAKATTRQGGLPRCWCVGQNTSKSWRIQVNPTKSNRKMGSKKRAVTAINRQ